MAILVVTEDARLAYAFPAPVDPHERMLNLYCLVAPGVYAPPTCFPAGDCAAFACLPGLPLPVAELFVGAPDSSL